jgi:hypothetical protein
MFSMYSLNRSQFESGALERNLTYRCMMQGLITERRSQLVLIHLSSYANGWTKVLQIVEIHVEIGGKFVVKSRSFWKCGDSGTSTYRENLSLVYY